jgi:hypothetical protein
MAPSDPLPPPRATTPSDLPHGRAAAALDPRCTNGHCSSNPSLPSSCIRSAAATDSGHTDGHCSPFILLLSVIFAQDRRCEAAPFARWTNDRRDGIKPMAPSCHVDIVHLFVFVFATRRAKARLMSVLIVLGDVCLSFDCNPRRNVGDPHSALRISVLAAGASMMKFSSVVIFELIF